MKSVVWTALLLASARAQPVPEAVISDPALDPDHPARFEVVHIPSHGARINGVLYLAPGPGLHRLAILFHGLPGNEQNLDLAQSIRRAGWHVLTLHYRGSWGSPGTYSYHHLLEDGLSALAFVNDERNASHFAIDRQRIVLAGHSTGGWVAALTAAASPRVAGLVLISGSDDAGEALAAHRTPSAWKQWIKEDFADSMETLRGCTPEGLGRELLANAPGWSFASVAAGLAGRPLLVITADDGLAAEGEALAAAVERAGSPATAGVSRLHISADHFYSGYRIALQAAVVNWLQSAFPK